MSAPCIINIMFATKECRQPRMCSSSEKIRCYEEPTKFSGACTVAQDCFSCGSSLYLFSCIFNYKFSVKLQYQCYRFLVTVQCLKTRWKKIQRESTEKQAGVPQPQLLEVRSEGRVPVINVAKHQVRTTIIVSAYCTQVTVQQITYEMRKSSLRDLLKTLGGGNCLICKTRHIGLSHGEKNWIR